MTEKKCFEKYEDDKLEIILDRFTLHRQGNCMMGSLMISDDTKEVKFGILEGIPQNENIKYKMTIEVFEVKKE